MGMRIFCAAAAIPQTGRAAPCAAVSSSVEGKSGDLGLAKLTGQEGRHSETEVR